jgi:energy-converting hydrogenase Eha subunit A
MIIVLLMTLITFFYATPFLPKKLFIDNKYNLRTIAGLKVYVIAFVWTVATVILPIINNNYPLDFDLVTTAFQRYLYIVVLILPFDIRDLQYDSLKLATIPQKIGIRNTKLLGLLLLALFFLSEFFKDTLSISQVIITVIITIITGLFIVFCNEDRNRSYSAFWVEGLPIVWLGLVLIFG